MQIPRDKAVVDVLGISVSYSIDSINLVESVGLELYFDVGFCRLFVSEFAGCGRP